MQLDQKLAIRLPGKLKRKVIRHGQQRMLHSGDIVREALVEYFDKRQPAAASSKPEQVAA